MDLNRIGVLKCPASCQQLSYQRLLCNKTTLSIPTIHQIELSSETIQKGSRMIDTPSIARRCRAVIVVVICFLAKSSFLISRHISWTITSLCSAFSFISLIFWVSSCHIIDHIQSTITVPNQLLPAVCTQKLEFMLGSDIFQAPPEVATVSGAQSSGQLQEMLCSIRWRFSWNQTRDYMRHSECRSQVTWMARMAAARSSFAFEPDVLCNTTIVSLPWL